MHAMQLTADAQWFLNQRNKPGQERHRLVGPLQIKGGNDFPTS